MRLLIILSTIFILHTSWAYPTNCNVAKNVSNKNENITLPYTLWIGSNITKIFKIKVSAPRNTSFYDVMQIAAEKNSHYTFNATDFPGMGHYITSLSGYQEDKVNNIYWMIYNLTQNPQPSAPPTNAQLSPLGVDSLNVQEGQHYLFWYQHFTWQ